MTLLLALCSVCALSPATVSAASAPGGDISNPVVRAVDIAKPAVVRILTTVKGTLTVDFGLLTDKVKFPRNDGSYDVKISGSGAFITSHGDVLTAAHVIKPPHDENLDMALRIKAAPDVAAYINDEFQPDMLYTEEEAMALLMYGFFRSDVSYGETTSEVYLSTAYLGTLSSKNIPEKAHAKVDKIKVESAAEENDLAIVHIDMENTPAIQLGNSNDVAQQDELTMIGFPGNGDLDDLEFLEPINLLTSSVTKLFVNATKIGRTGEPVIQVSGSVGPGNSGGPVLDKNGTIVGIASFYISRSGVPEGIGFLRASSTAQFLIETLKLDTKPGLFQKSWQQAFNDYASTTPGHWHKAVKGFEQLGKDYPQFLALTPYLEYAREQAKHEKLPEPPKPKADYSWLWIVAVMGACLLIALTVLMIVRWRKKGIAQTPAPVQFPVGSIPQVYQTSPIAEGQGYRLQEPPVPITPSIVLSYQSQQEFANQTVAQERITQEQILPETVPGEEVLVTSTEQEQAVIEQTSVALDDQDQTRVGQEPVIHLTELPTVEAQVALTIPEEQTPGVPEEGLPAEEGMEHTQPMRAISLDKEEPEKTQLVDILPAEEQREKILHASAVSTDS